MAVHIFTTGGTIDKVYFDALSEYQIGDSAIPGIFAEANVTCDYQITELMRKDSLEITEEDRKLMAAELGASEHSRVLLTHGTDTMAQTAQVLAESTSDKTLGDKTIVLTGAMQPASLRVTDSIFNVGFAMAAVQTLPPGVYIAMNGRVFNAGEVKKNRAEGRFEADS